MSAQKTMLAGRAGDDETARDSALLAFLNPDHIVQFYEKGEFLLDSTSRFLGTGLETGDSGVVIATEPHRQALEARLQSDGLDVAGARSQSNDRELSRQAGFDHHLVKPVDMEKLEALLKIAD